MSPLFIVLIKNNRSYLRPSVKKAAEGLDLCAGNMHNRKDKFSASCRTVPEEDIMRHDIVIVKISDAAVMKKKRRAVSFPFEYSISFNPKSFL